MMECPTGAVEEPAAALGDEFDHIGKARHAVGQDPAGEPVRMPERVAAGLARGVDQRIAHLPWAKNVELPPLAQPRHLRDLGHPIVRHCVLYERDLGLRRAACRHVAKTAR